MGYGSVGFNGTTKVNTPNIDGANGDLEISRAEYHEKLQGFWLGVCIAKIYS